jgi:BolA protein
MNSEERIKVMTARLKNKFSPDQLEVIDDSEQHRGHPGAQSGAGHYTVVIQSDFFIHQSRVDAHRAIYQLLNDLIPSEIHALKIKIVK